MSVLARRVMVRASSSLPGVRCVAGEDMLSTDFLMLRLFISSMCASALHSWIILCLVWEFDVVYGFRGDSLGSRAFHLGGLFLRSHSVGNTRDTRVARSECEYRFYPFLIL